MGASNTRGMGKKARKPLTSNSLFIENGRPPRKNIVFVKMSMWPVYW